MFNGFSISSNIRKILISGKIPWTFLPISFQITFHVAQLWIIVKECQNVSKPVVQSLETLLDSSIQQIKHENSNNNVHQRFELSTYYGQNKEHWRILEIDYTVLTAMLSPLITTILTLIQFEITS
ncbi:CLUMA_CG006210, isoform A [Clunio marinus]|uniref:CLUMA_CG006210, isoform A n=1 Tax=Clunio marinus TaxID=568069 RepID=A0A1J1HX37_9DIPT|nr:CLUMA_CG006210, isoform A [Clunio marinus]